MKPSGRWPIVEFNGQFTSSDITTILPAKAGCFYVIGQLDVSISGAVLPVASFIRLASNGTTIFKQNGDATVQPFIQLPGLTTPIGAYIDLEAGITSTEVISYNGWAEVRG